MTDRDRPKGPGVYGPGVPDSLSGELDLTTAPLQREDLEDTLVGLPESVYVGATLEALRHNIEEQAGQIEELEESLRLTARVLCSIVEPYFDGDGLDALCDRLKISRPPRHGR